MPGSLEIFFIRTTSEIDRVLYLRPFSSCTSSHLISFPFFLFFFFALQAVECFERAPLFCLARMVAMQVAEISKL